MKVKERRKALPSGARRTEKARGAPYEEGAPRCERVSLTDRP